MRKFPERELDFSPHILQKLGESEELKLEKQKTFFLSGHMLG